MKKMMLLAGMALMAFGLAGSTAYAQATTMDLVGDQPSATLLLPYFAVNLADPAGLNTQFTVNNASATAVLAHVVVWSDLSVPVLAFNIYLTGYDMQVVNMRNVLNGKLPITASAGQDPTDTRSPQGQYSQDINFASCNGQHPYPATLTAPFVTHLKNSLTGKASAYFSGQCAGTPSADLARGYVTVDTVNNCTIRVPGDPGYFIPGGSGDATNQNVLWGDYVYLDAANHVSDGDSLVHIRANPTDPETSVPGAYTFYGRYSSWTAADNRQPLATTFVAPYRKSGPPFTGGTSLIVWRDPRVNQQPFVCPAMAGRPLWYPLSQERIIAFGAEEDVAAPAIGLKPFGAATKRVQVGSAVLPVTPVVGWLYLNLNHTAGTGPGNDPNAAQAWVFVTRSTTGVYEAGVRAVQMDSALNTDHYVPPVGP